MARTNPQFVMSDLWPGSPSAEVPIREPHQMFIRLLMCYPQTPARARMIDRLSKLKSWRCLDISTLTSTGTGINPKGIMTRYHLQLGGMLRFIISRTLVGVKNFVAILTEDSGFPPEPYEFILNEYTARYLQLEKHSNKRKISEDSWTELPDVPSDDHHDSDVSCDLFLSQKEQL